MQLAIPETRRTNGLLHQTEPERKFWVFRDWLIRLGHSSEYLCSDEDEYEGAGQAGDGGCVRG